MPTPSERRRDATDLLLRRLAKLALIWMGSRVGAALLTAPFLTEDRLPGGLGLLGVQLPFWGLNIAGLWWMARREDRSFTRFTHWGFEPSDAWVGVAAGFALHWGVELLYRALSAMGVEGDPSASARDLVDASGGVVGGVSLVVAVVVCAPVVEELFYRGVSQTTALGLSLPGRDREERTFDPDEPRVTAGRGLAALAVVAVLFAISHITSDSVVVQVPGLTLVGMVLGLLAWRFGRLGPAIVAHGTFNLLTLLVLWGVHTPFLAG